MRAHEPRRRSTACQRLHEHVAVVGVVVLQADQRQDGRPDVGVVGPGGRVDAVPGRRPGPTKPTQVLPISCWMSPWFQAKPGVTHWSLTPRARAESLEEEVRVAEVDEGRRAVRVAVDHVQRLQLDRVGQRSP